VHIQATKEIIRKGIENHLIVDSLYCSDSLELVVSISCRECLSGRRSETRADVSVREVAARNIRDIHNETSFKISKAPCTSAGTMTVAVISKLVIQSV